MALSSETIGRLLASGRNYAGQIIAFASGIGIMSAAQQKDLMQSIGEIYNGGAMIFHGATSAWTIVAVVAAPIIGPILAHWASNSAKLSNQANAVNVAALDPNTVISPEVKVSIASAAAAAVTDQTTPTPPEAKAVIVEVAKKI